jgi:hypothetical protein
MTPADRLTVPKTTDLGKVAAATVSHVAHLRVVPGTARTILNGKVAPPRRLANRDRRSREHLRRPKSTP